MKKVFVVATMALFVFASCKKDYTCECTTDILGTTTTVTSTLNGKKKDVKTACENGSSTVADITTTCVIK